MKTLTILAVFAGFLAVERVVAAEGKIEPPSAEELRATRTLVDEVFPIAADADRDSILSVVDELKGAANAGDLSSADRYGISIRLEELAIRIGDPGLWESTIDSRSAQFAVDHWATNSQGLLNFARENGAEFAKSSLVDRALQIAKDRSTEDHVSDATAFLEALAKASSAFAADQNAIRRIGATLTGLRERQAQETAFALALKTLKTNPEDRHANFVKGAYLAVVDGDWKQAITAFAKSDVSPFASAANLEIEGKDDVAIAEAWGDVAKSYSQDFNTKNSLTDAVIQHAIDLKTQVSARASSLEQKKYAAEVLTLKKGLRAHTPAPPKMATTSLPAPPASRSTDKESRPMKRIRLARERAAPDAVKIGNHYYKKVSKPKLPWPAAAQECARMGGYLACIETEEERRMVVAALGTPLVLWLGGRVAPNGKPIWINGVPISTHVLDLNRKYKYVAFTKDGGLNVRPKSGNAPYHVKSIKGYLCEWDY